MRLAPEAHDRIETFLRDFLSDPTLLLPRVAIFAGRLSGWLTQACGVGAITIRRTIFVQPALLERDGGRLTVPSNLLVHEAVHVIQYDRAGFLPFLASYLGGYFDALNRQRSWRRAARMAAYLSIDEEGLARAAEIDYARWKQDNTH